MKSILALLALSFPLGCSAQSPDQPVTILADKPLATIRVGSDFSKNNWSILPETQPDVYEVNVEGPPVDVTFITDLDSLSFSVESGQTYPFVVLLNGRDSAFTEIKGIAYKKPAHFDNAYKKANTGKTLAEIPEVYELVNILFAITPTFQKDSGIVSRQPPYYQRMTRHFAPYGQEPAVALMDSLAQAGRYFDIKMDAYSFGFDKQGRLVRSPVYDRINWGRSNSLLPFIPRLQEFSDKAKFRPFYQENRAIYDAQISVYRDSLKVGDMVSWLNKNFPDTRYDAFKIIWSPLVGNSQSAAWFKDNGFSEMQAHVNFPYRTATRSNTISPLSNQVRRGSIVFTEINHSFINPEGEKSRYSAGINGAFADLPTWAEGVALQYYGNPYSCFNEYMNWGLVSLWYVDYADRQDLEKMFTQVETNMVKNRGFRRFAEFNRFLVGIYQGRKPGVSVADLYPQIVAWFVENK